MQPNQINQIQSFESIIDEIDFGIVYHNEAGLIQYANKAAQDILGLTFGQMIGRDSLHPEWRTIHLDGSPFPGNEHPAVVSLMSGKPVHDEIMGVYHFDKKDFVWILVNTIPISEPNRDKPIGVYATFKNVTTKIDAQKSLEYQVALSSILVDATTQFVNADLKKIDLALNGLLSRIGAFLQVDRVYTLIFKNDYIVPSSSFSWYADAVSIEKNYGTKTNVLLAHALFSEVKNNTPLFFDDCSLLPDDLAIKEALGSAKIASIYCMPVMLKNTCIGFVGFDSLNKKHTLNNHEKNLLKVFAELIANIEERKKNAFFIDETLKELKGVYQVSQLNAVHGITDDLYFQKLIASVKDSFCLPQNTSVDISYLGRTYTSEKYEQSNNFVEKELFSSEGLRLGKMAVYVPTDTEFLPSEEEFLNTVVRLITQKHSRDMFEKSLLASEEKYRIIADNNYNWEFWENAAGVFIYHSPSCLQVSGYSAEELLADLTLFKSLIHREDVSEFESYKERVYKQKQAGKHQFRMYSKSGQLKHLEHVCKPVFSITNSFLGFRGSYIDITEKVEAFNKLSKSEQRLNNLLNSQTSFVLRTDIQGRHTYWNNAFETAFGWIYESNLHQGDSLRSICEHHHARAIEAVTECITNPGKIIKVELDKPGKNKDIRTTFWEFLCLTNDAGVPQEIQCMGIDITDRIEAEKTIVDLNQNLEQKVLDRTNELIKTNHELELAKKEADTANEEKSLFLSRMSHELRTPMNSILGFAQILEMTNLDERQKKSVSHIVKSGNHLLNLINEVLDIARIESGKVSLSIESVSLNEVLSEVLELASPAASIRNINIHYVPTNKVFVLADKQRLKQVLINIINNAIKYNHPGGKVWIDTKSESEFIKVLIHDNGFGIKPDDIKKLFVPFERLGAEKYQIEGTGLGLSVVKHLMQSMQGAMGVESKFGKGSTFWLTFKLANMSTILLDRDGKEDFRENILHKNAANLSQKLSTLLYIEDNISNVELVETILENNFPSVHLITSLYGKNAVSLAKKHKPKLILLDLNLPDMHGSKVLEALKLDVDVCQIPVVVLSADAMENQVKSMLGLGAVNYVTKPFKMKEFVDVLKVYCK